MTADAQTFYDTVYAKGLHRRMWHVEEAPPEFASLVPGDGAPQRVLDIGCGAGTLALHFARRQGEATGMDFAPSAIARLKEQAESEKLAVTAVVGDVLAAQPGFIDRFDLVCDRQCFQDLSAEGRLLYAHNLRLWLRAGGRFALETMVRPEGASMGRQGTSVEAGEVERIFRDFSCVRRQESAEQPAAGLFRRHFFLFEKQGEALLPREALP